MPAKRQTAPNGRLLGIPAKVNIDSGRKPNGVPERGKQQSERSDAGMVIVE
jgi:hypothetical protein